MSLRDTGRDSSAASSFLGAVGRRPRGKSGGFKALAREEGEPPTSSPTCGLSVGLQHTRSPFPRAGSRHLRLATFRQLARNDPSPGGAGYTAAGGAT